MPLIKLNTQSATSLDATKLTGNLPAISGASLTGISSEEILVASGNVTSGSSSEIIVDNCFTSTYTSYRIIFFDVMTNGGTNSTDTRFKVRTGGGSGTNYNSSQYFARCLRNYSGHSNYETDNVSGVDHFKLAYSAIQYGSSDSNNAMAFEMRIFNTNGFQAKVLWNLSAQHSGSNDNMIWSNGGGGITDALTITGFNLYNTDSRNFTNYKYRVLGLA